MKLRMYQLILSLTVIFAISAPSNAVVIELSPALQVSETGESVSIDLVASDLGSPLTTVIGNYDVDIEFDDSALAFTGFSFSDALGSVISTDFFDFTSDAFDGFSGMISSTEVNLNLFSFLFESDLALLQSDSTVLATLNFDVLALDVGEFTDVTIASVNSLVDAAGFDITGFSTMDARINNPSDIASPKVAIMLSLLIAAITLRRKFLLKSKV
ncbi:hypothetical protein ACOI22_14630 [Glaciecola sp. 2405UD65-10]|uniref:hypothetical protein n=1 Tax=Glaciecola sp. 2405UD65-10 TaxID=3397244 RepID=UPI003B5A9186